MGEPDRGAGLLVGQRFGVGQAGESVDRRVQTDIARAGVGLLGAFDGSGVRAGLAVNTPEGNIRPISGPCDGLIHQIGHNARGTHVVSGAVAYSNLSLPRDALRV